MSNAITLQTVVKAGAGQVSSQLDDEVVILHLGQGLYFGLDPVGACIWNLIQKPARVSEIVAGVRREYEVDEAVCERDLCALLRELKKRDLIEIGAGRDA